MVIKFAPNIIVLDVEVGRTNSIKKVPQLKLCAPNIPIIFISSHTEENLVTDALACGGYVYLKKPFSIKVLIAYINRFACTQNEDYNIIHFGLFSLNIDNRALSIKNSIHIPLPAMEYNLLRLLLINKNNVVKRENIMAKLWPNSIGSNESLNNYVNRLRQHLSCDKTISIKTIRNIGLCLSITDTNKDDDD